MSPSTTRAAWIAGLAVLLFAPIGLRLWTLERTGFWDEATIVTGLLATSTLAATAVLPSRVKNLTRAFGLEAVMAMHRTLGLVTVALLALHIMAVVIDDPRNVWLLVPGVAPGRALAGTAGIVAVVALAAFATARARARARYEVWRWWHIALAFAVLIPSAIHIVLLQHLVLDPIAGTFLGAVAGLVIAILGYRWAVRPLDIRDRFIVADVRRESETVSTIELRPADPRAPLCFDPGQFAWLRMSQSPFAEEHPFTISSAAQDGTRPTFTVRHRGDWTSQRLAALWPGDVVWLDGPHGGMTPNHRTTGLVLIAGGVGITPMMSMVRTLARHGDPRPVRMILADRPGEMLFRDELATLQTQLHMDVTETRRAPITPEWLATTLPGQFRRDQLDYFVCGSPRLVEDTTSALDALGIPERRVHTELFDVA